MLNSHFDKYFGLVLKCFLSVIASCRIYPRGLLPLGFQTSFYNLKHKGAGVACTPHCLGGAQRTHSSGQTANTNLKLSVLFSGTEVGDGGGREKR